MEIVRGIQALGRSFESPVVTIGNFDGVHLGHQQIIQTTIQKARASKGTAIAYTFRPHPQVALRPEARVHLLTHYDEKLELLRATGIDVVIEEPFSRGFSTVAPAQFFTDILLRRLNAQAIVVGYDFAFGKERQGHLDALSVFCKDAGVELTIVQPQKVSGEVVSSSRVRQHLFAGDLPAARRLLGYDFFYRGVVIRGEGRGRKIGFPTANLKLEEKLVLPFGVYASWAFVDGVRYASVTNIGVRPTFDLQEMPALIEVHLLDQTLDLYGRTLQVSFVERLRDEKRFSGIDALKAQIALDAEKSRQILS